MTNKDLLEKSAIGYHHLLEFTKDHDSKHLPYLKTYYEQIVTFMLLCYYQSNIDIVDIKNKKTLEDVFTMKSFERVNSGYSYENSKYMEYGIGIVTENSAIPYETQVRYIRNALAHKSFDITEDGNFHIQTPYYEAFVDPKWLEALLFSVLSDTRSDFKKGMSESVTFNYRSDKPLTPSDFRSYIAKGYISLIDIELGTGSKDKVKQALGLREAAPIEEFNDIYQLMRQVILQGLNDRITDQDGPEEHITKIKKFIKDLNKDLDGAIILSHRHLDYQDFEDLINSPLFAKLKTYDDQVRHMYNHYITSKNEDVNNTLSYCCLKHVLFKIYNNEELTPEDYLYLEESLGFIAKAYGNLVVNNICSTADFRENSYLVGKLFKQDMSIDFGYAKNYYKEAIKQLITSLEQIKEYSHDEEISDQEKSIKYTLNRYNRRLYQISQGVYPSFHIQMRNMLAHGYLKCHQDQIHLYEKAKAITIPRYSNKKKKWNTKDLKTPVIYNVDMSLETYNNMLTSLSLKYGIDPLKTVDFSKSDFQM